MANSKPIARSQLTRISLPHSRGGARKIFPRATDLSPGCLEEIPTARRGIYIKLFRRLYSPLSQVTIFLPDSQTVSENVAARAREAVAA